MSHAFAMRVIITLTTTAGVDDRSNGAYAGMAVSCAPSWETTERNISCQRALTRLKRRPRPLSKGCGRIREPFLRSGNESPRSGFSRSYNLGSSGRGLRMIHYPQELIQSRRDQSTPTLEKCLVVPTSKNRRLRWYALSIKSSRSRLRNHVGKVSFWRFVANLAVRLPANKAQVCDVICFAPRVARLQNCLRKDVVELELVMRPGVVKC